MELIQHIELVKDQLGFHERQAVKFEREHHRSLVHIRTAEGFRLLLADLIQLQDWQTAHPNWMTAPTRKAKRLALTWEEVEGLPKEVLDELSVTEADHAEFNIASAVRALGGVAALDRIIVYLYKEFGEIQKRAPLNQRLYRMTQKEMIYSVPGKKGVYSTDPMTEEEAAELI